MKEDLGAAREQMTCLGAYKDVRVCLFERRSVIFSVARDELGAGVVTRWPYRSLYMESQP